MLDTLITRYRPLEFADVVGHTQQLRALERRLRETTASHGYLLTGPSGVGKTTIARIIARHLDCDVVEIDAASQNGVDAMRELIELGRHKSLTGAGRRMFLLNEVQRLTRNAWDSLLTTLEEPPEHLYFAFTSTEPDRIPDAVMTRCYVLKLDTLSTSEMEDIIDAVCDLEGWRLNGEIRRMLLTAANGQPRKALTMLDSVHYIEKPDEARRVLALQEASEPMIKLCRYLMNGQRDWSQIQNFLATIGDESFDEALTHCGRYVMAGLLRADTENQARLMYRILEALTFPRTTYDRKLHFVTAIAGFVLG